MNELARSFASTIRAVTLTPKLGYLVIFFDLKINIQMIPQLSGTYGYTLTGHFIRHTCPTAR